jgi:alpha-mannosidase
MPPPRILHLIGQAHLDPVWLWPWQDGCSEALTTIQSAVNFLDTEPDFKFTRASSEIYRWVEQADPRLFARIKHYVAAGRWEIIGGWIEQPDCNLPSTESFVRQSLYGKRYFREEFGVEVKIGYNVDSFGHAAGLPQLLQRAGFTHYIFMRPMAWERDLPTLFWWEAPDGSRVLAWRLPQNYGQAPDADADQFEAEVRRAAEVGFAPGMQHGMFFYGVGNHGGGPTRRQLERIRKLQNDTELPEIRLSTVGQFFAAIEADPAMADVPVIRGELNKHAPGCYSAHAQIKRDTRRAERRLGLAETAATMARIATDGPSPAAGLQRPWEHLLFNQFHDILGGTCTASNDPSIRDRFGAAIHPADEVATLALHRVARAVDLASVPEGALFLWNPLPWPRLVEVGFDTFEAPNGGAPLLRLVAPDGRKDYPIQWSTAEPCFGPMGASWRRLNAVVPLPACGYRVFTLDTVEPAPSGVPLQPCFVADESKLGLRQWDTPCGPRLLAAPITLSIWQDTGDTWGHKLDRYDERLGAPTLQETTVLTEGPLLRCVRQRATWKNSEIIVHYRQWIHQPGLEIGLRVNWQEHGEILRLEMPTALTQAVTAAASPGGTVQRATNSGEQPASEWVVLTGRLADQQTHSMQLVTDGGLSYSTVEGCLRTIIARSGYYAHHQPKSPSDPLANPRLDQGWQESRWWLNAGPGDFNAIAAHRHAAEVLHPAERVYDSAHPGTLPREASLLSIEPANVCLTACKVAEAGDGWIVRLLETTGRTTTCTMRSTIGEARTWTVEVPAAALITVKLPLNGNAAAVITDLLENPL